MSEDMRRETFSMRLIKEKLYNSDQTLEDG